MKVSGLCPLVRKVMPSTTDRRTQHWGVRSFELPWSCGEVNRKGLRHRSSGTIGPQVRKVTPSTPERQPQHWGVRSFELRRSCGAVGSRNTPVTEAANENSSQHWGGVRCNCVSPWLSNGRWRRRRWRWREVGWGDNNSGRMLRWNIDINSSKNTSYLNN